MAFKKPWQIVAIASGVLLLLLSAFVVRTLLKANFFATLQPEFAGTCRAMASPPGPEDLAIDRATGTLYLSSYDRRSTWGGQDSDVNGGIYSLDLHDPLAGFVLMSDPVTASGGSGPIAPFRPHGISLFVSESGTKTLMAVSHPGDGLNTIEIFDLYEEELEGMTVRQLVHRESVSDSALVSPNDVVAIDGQRFYATNDHGSTSDFGKTLEDFLCQDKSNVIYFDGQEARVVAEALRYANGINVSADGGTLSVAETTGQSVRFYDRDLASGGLILSDKVDVATGVDNIDVAPDGALWVAGHPQPLKFLGHSKDKANLSPSHIIHIERNEDGIGGKVDQIYLNLGEEISGSSVAVVYRNQMFIGQVFDDHILICDLP